MAITFWIFFHPTRLFRPTQLFIWMNFPPYTTIPHCTAIRHYIVVVTKYPLTAIDRTKYPMIAIDRSTREDKHCTHLQSVQHHDKCRQTTVCWFVLRSKLGGETKVSHHMASMKSLSEHSTAFIWAEWDASVRKKAPVELPRWRLLIGWRHQVTATYILDLTECSWHMGMAWILQISVDTDRQITNVYIIRTILSYKFKISLSNYIESEARKLGH